MLFNAKKEIGITGTLIDAQNGVDRLNLFDNVLQSGPYASQTS